MRLSVFVKGLWHETCSDQIAETLYEATSQTETFYQRKLAARACRSTRPRVFTFVWSAVFYLLWSTSLVRRTYVAATQITQTEYQQHFINRIDLVCQPGKLASEDLTSVRAKQQGACGDRAAHVNCFCQVSHNQAYYQVHL